MLSQDEVFEAVVGFFLEREDPLRKAPGKRRAPPTYLTPYGTYVPEAVKRAVRSRAKDGCEIPGCLHHVFMAFSHIQGRAGGSPREPEHLLLLCTQHHALFDMGIIRFGWWDGDEPLFFDRDGDYPKNRWEALLKGHDPPDQVGEQPPTWEFASQGDSPVDRTTSLVHC